LDPGACIDENAALALLEGRLSRDAANAAEEHLAGCADCRALLEQLADLAPDLATAQTVRLSFDGESVDDAAPPSVTRGEAVGRYVVEERVGMGGMGVVYVARDRQLGRRVALKLLRRRRAEEAVAQLRLLREAQALAKLSHANVVTVFDVGTFHQQVFVAMELVDGGTLSSWLQRGDRSLDEILAMFRAAGAGLLAAHAAGIVHRDFKPDNVLIGDDGRVRVTDFGLASPPRSTDGAPRFDNRLTETGAVFGTPAYMAPEQRDGGRVDERSDQYSFCVALFEALYGRLPEAALTSAPRFNVPRRIRRALQRGLAQDPAARFPSLQALLSALAWDRAARRRPFVLGAAAWPCRRLSASTRARGA
jgi:serine/threonine-protein kinase